MSAGGPSLPDILSAGRYAEGQWVGDVGGIRGPNVPSVVWDPSGGGNMRGGQPPTSSMGVDIKAFDFISKQFMCAPFHDETNLLIMPEMLCFTVNMVDPDTGSSQVLTLSKVNQIMHDEWEHFLEQAKNYPDSPQGTFYKALETYGEVGLMNYHRAKMEGRLDDTYDSNLKSFYDRSLEDDYHWLTRFGILHHISFAGSVINTNRAIGLETMDRTSYSDHYTTVNVCLAKRARVANVFGPATEIKTGSKLWLILRRKSKPNGAHVGAFQIVPGGSAKYDYPLASQLEYNDPSNKTERAFFWRVGSVLRQGDSSPAGISIQEAANLGYKCSERQAYEAHGTLPTLYVALGFKH